MDVDALIAVTYEDLFDQEVKRKGKGETALEYLPPERTKGPQGFFLGGQILSANFTLG